MLEAILHCANPQCCNFLKVTARSKAALRSTCCSECCAACKSSACQKQPEPLQILWIQTLPNANDKRHRAWSPERLAKCKAHYADPAWAQRRKARFLKSLLADPNTVQQSLLKRSQTLSQHPEIRQGAAAKWHKAYDADKAWQRSKKLALSKQWAAKPIGQRVSPDIAAKAQAMQCPLELLHNRVIYRCHICGHIGLYATNGSDYDRLQLGLTICKHCRAKKPHASGQEQQVADYLQSELGFEIQQNRRDLLPNGQELDVYLPSKQIGIEYCGLLWHSEACARGRKYHLTKTEMARAAGIRLITIFSDEWMYHQAAVKGRLAAILGKAQHIYARNCTVQEVPLNSLPQARQFLQQNHLQGDTSSITSCYALYYQGAVVSVMTFRNSTAGSCSAYPKGTVELSRFCCKIGIAVAGGASRLLKHALADHPQWSTVVSFADKRWSLGGVYKALGFSLEKQLGPQYSYITKGCLHRIYRSQYRLHSMPLEWHVFDQAGTRLDNRPERDICFSHQVYRVWDCGLDKWVLHRP